MKLSSCLTSRAYSRAAVFACLFIFTCVVSGRAQYPVSSIDSLVRRVQEDQGFEGNVLVADHGRIVYEKSIGAGLSANSVFDLASVSKAFTAVAIMQLVEAGKLSLADNIYQFFPNLPYKGVNVWHLLTHTSGLEDYLAGSVRTVAGLDKPTDAETEDAYGFVHPPLRFYPDSNWSYSNTNYLLLAMIVEKVSGETFPDYVQAHIFDPAGMIHSYVLRKNVPRYTESGVVVPRYYPDYFALRPVRVDSIPFARRYYSLIDNTYGDGGIFSTAGDLFKFFRALQKGVLLEPIAMKQMYSEAPLLNFADYEAGNAGSNYSSEYGMGWLVATDHSHGKIVWHSGSNPGTLTFFMQNVTRDQCVIVLNDNWYKGTYHLGGSIMSILDGRPEELLPPSLARKVGQAYTLYGADTAIALLNRLKTSPDYHVALQEMNDLGYGLLNRGDTRTAIAVFRVNAAEYPQSSDAWDSLAEACYKAGDRVEAAGDYKRSLQLNPRDENGRAMLEKINDGQ